MKYAVVIPARYKSTRLPGKPLVDINGVPMIRRVWERCCIAVDPSLVYIATDDERILSVCKEFTDNVLMTSENCLTGTDRVCEAVKLIGDLDFVINVQGDEPIINPADIKTIIDTYIENPGCLVNGMAQIQSEEEYYSNTIPKLVFREDFRLLYMSRAPIPGNKSERFVQGWKQICIYAFPVNALHAFASRKEKTLFENEEDIEILRFLEMGFDVKMRAMIGKSIAVDTPSDVTKVESCLSIDSNYNL